MLGYTRYGCVDAVCSPKLPFSRPPLFPFSFYAFWLFKPLPPNSLSIMPYESIKPKVTNMY